MNSFQWRDDTKLMILIWVLGGMEKDHVSSYNAYDICGELYSTHMGQYICSDTTQKLFTLNTKLITSSKNLKYVA